MNRQTIVIVTAALVMLAFGLGAYFYNARQAGEVSRLASDGDPAFNRANSPSKGSQTARVQIMEFFDPACESCRMFYPHVEDIMQGSFGKVRLTLRYATFHNGSDYVARVLEAARMQGNDAYWKSLEIVLVAQPLWADHRRPQPQLVWSFLEGSGLDIERAKRDMNDPRISELLKQDAADLAKLKVTQTPTFFINGKPLRDFGVDGLRAQVKSEIGVLYKP